ncbi:MAG TPA: anthrone oxygenase family protein [Mycobacteriales bacterium]|nr:anthrone oxygenase family protein [Mycobacteriales bacterium]
MTETSTGAAEAGIYELTRGASLVAATITMGLMAGLFFAWAQGVMTGLHRSSDRTFVEALQQMNVAILNGWFALAFGGAVVLTAVTGVLHLRSDARSVLPWIVAAFVLYLLVLIVTAAVNVPLNNELMAAGPVDRITDLAGVRAHFETTWVRWNILRAVLNAAAFGCLTWALVLHGRLTGRG